MIDKGQLRKPAGYTPHELAIWSPKLDDDRVMGPLTLVFPLPSGWTIDGKSISLDRLSIKQRTQILALRKMIPPAAEEAWQMRLNLTIPWHKVWSIKSFYATPRDQFTWLKVMHRNLFLFAGNGGAGDTACRACPQRENIEHLVRCSVIQADFWEPLLALMILASQHPHQAKKSPSYSWVVLATPQY